MNSSTFADATKQALERIEIDVLSVYRTLEQVTDPCVPSCYRTFSTAAFSSTVTGQASRVVATTESERCLLPNCSIAAMTSPSSRPCAVRWYSTRGGISRKASRCTNPNSSSSLSRLESVLELICPNFVRKALKRMEPCKRFMTISNTQVSPKRWMARRRGVSSHFSGKLSG